MYGENIRTARRIKGLKQQELAERCGLARESLSRIERGHSKPSLDLLEKIAAELDVTVSDLTAIKTEATA